MKYQDMIKSKNGINGEFLVQIAKALDGTSKSIKQGPESIIAKSYKGDNSVNQGFYEAMVEEALKTASVTDLDSTMAAVNRLLPLVDNHTSRLDRKARSIEDHTDRLDRKAETLLLMEGAILEIINTIKTLREGLESKLLEMPSDLVLAGNKLYLKSPTGNVIGAGITLPTTGGVEDILLTGLSFSEAGPISLLEGQKKQLVVRYAPTNTTQIGVTYSSNSANVTVTAAGEITARTRGTAVITATSIANNTKTATMTVNVSAAAPPVTGISITPSSASLKVGDTQVITWTTTPAGSIGGSYLISPSNDSCRVIHNYPTEKSCTIVAQSAGECTITVTESTSRVSSTMRTTVTAEATNVRVKSAQYVITPNKGVWSKRRVSDSNVVVPANKLVSKLYVGVVSSSVVGSHVPLTVAAIGKTSKIILDVFNIQATVEDPHPSLWGTTANANSKHASMTINKTYAEDVFFMFSAQTSSTSPLCTNSTAVATPVDYHIGLPGSAGATAIVNLQVGWKIEVDGVNIREVIHPDKHYCWVAADYLS